MKRFLLLLMLLAACTDPGSVPAPEATHTISIDTAAIRRAAEACAAAYLAEHGTPPTTLRGFAGIESNCQRALFMRLDPATQYTLWAEQLDYYARTEPLNDLQHAALANIRGMLSVEYFTLPPSQRPEPDQEELVRLFSAERAAAYFYRLGSMYE